MNNKENLNCGTGKNILATEHKSLLYLTLQDFDRQFWGIGAIF